MMIFGECLLNIVWHDEFACMLVIILFNGLASDDGVAPNGINMNIKQNMTHLILSSLSIEDLCH